MPRVDQAEAERFVAEQQHDHIWLTVAGDPWAIREIRRTDDHMEVHLWRGGRNMEALAYRWIWFYPPYDWTEYCDNAVAMMDAHQPLDDLIKARKK